MKENKNVDANIFRTGLALIILFAGSKAEAAEYAITDLGTLGGASSGAAALNNEGLVAGSSQIPSSAMHGFLWEDGVMEGLGTPGGFLVSYASGLNDSGLIVGSTNGEFQSEYAYMYQDGAWSYLGTLPGPALMYSSARDVNNAGQIVGYSFTLGPGSDSRAWIWEDGVMADLGAPTGQRNSAGGINELGQVVGSMDFPEPDAGRRAFLWDDGVFTDLGTLPGDTASSASDINDLGQVCGGSSHPVPPYFTAQTACMWDGKAVIDLGSLPGYAVSTATAINNQGKVVGWVRTGLSGGSTAAFIWEDGVMQNLNDLVAAEAGWELRSAADTNDAGQIVGWGEAPNGQSHAFLLTPCGGTDSDCDGDVDLLDFWEFEACLTGPTEVLDSDCEAMDFDGDDDVDLLDFAEFTLAFTSA
jgi:probable HAF family extracellular repeat protein